MDMSFLPCAAGYATLVVGENKTTDYLRQIERQVPTGARVCSKLPAAIEHLDRLGAT